MEPGNTLEDIEAYLRSQERKRRIRRNLILAVIFLALLLLIPWQCEESGTLPSDHGNASRPHYLESGTTKPSPVIDGNKHFNRKEFSNSQKLNVIWGRQLADQIRSFGPKFRDCIRDDMEISWIFQYNPGTGKIRHQDFLGRDGETIPKNFSVCLRGKIPSMISIKGKFPNTWYRVSIAIIGSGSPSIKNETSEIPSTDFP